MKRHLGSALIGGTAMVLAMSASWAQTVRTVELAPNAQKAERLPTPIKPSRPGIKAPEIDVGAGGGAIALLVGGLLLAAERRRRSS